MFFNMSAIGPKYILAIVLGSIFALLCFIFLVVLIYKAYKKAKLKQRLIVAYSDENLAKMDYDNAPYGELIEDLIKESDDKVVSTAEPNDLTEAAVASDESSSEIQDVE